VQRDPAIAYEPSELNREMERCGIHAAIVENELSVHYAYRPGNSALIDFCDENPRLYPLLYCTATYKWEQREGEAYLHELCRKASGIVARPKTSSFSLEPRAIEEFVGVLTGENLPLVLPASEIQIFDTGYSQLEALLEAFPSLSVLLTGVSWGGARYLFQLLERHGNLHFDLSDNQLNGILEITKKYFGVERALFGSGYPNRCMGVIKALVEYADLSEHEKDMVSHGNACRLFGIDKSELKPYRENMLDEIASTVDSGSPLDKWFVFDSHAHIADDDDDCVSQLLMPMANKDDIASRMDRLGVDKIILSAWEGIKTGGERANKTVYKAMTAYPGKILGYATANPNYKGDIENAIENLEQRGFLGLKPYAVLHGKLTDPEYARWLEYGNRRKMFVLVHSGSQEIADQVAELAPRYRDLIFIMAHSGVDMSAARINVALAKLNDNVVLEITYTSCTRGAIEYMVSELGSERVLFGTDTPMRDPAPQLAWVAYAEISVEEKLDILGRNMQKIVDRVLPPCGM